MAQNYRSFTLIKSDKSLLSPFACSLFPLPKGVESSVPVLGILEWSGHLSCDHHGALATGSSTPKGKVRR
jgi:hypothetical protein